MTLSRPHLVNLVLFLDNATVTGKTALLAWTETYQAVIAEINALDAVEAAAALVAKKGVDSPPPTMPNGAASGVDE